MGEEPVTVFIAARAVPCFVDAVAVLAVVLDAFTSYFAGEDAEVVEPPFGGGIVAGAGGIIGEESGKGGGRGCCGGGLWFFCVRHGCGTVDIGDLGGKVVVRSCQVTNRIDIVASKAESGLQGWCLRQMVGGEVWDGWAWSEVLKVRGQKKSYRPRALILAGSHPDG